MNRRRLLFALASAGIALGWVTLAPDRTARSIREEVRGWLFVGAPLMEVQTPTADLELPVGAVELLVAFVGGSRVAVETFECWLNDENVTSTLTLARNGATGSIVGLHEGENRIRLRVFGRSWWGREYVEEERTFVVRVRPLPFLDIA
jgi:hypothetical protein